MSASEAALNAFGDAAGALAKAFAPLQELVNERDALKAEGDALKEELEKMRPELERVQGATRPWWHLTNDKWKERYVKTSRDLSHWIKKCTEAEKKANYLETCLAQTTQLGADWATRAVKAESALEDHELHVHSLLSEHWAGRALKAEAKVDKLSKDLAAVVEANSKAQYELAKIRRGGLSATNEPGTITAIAIDSCGGVSVHPSGFSDFHAAKYCTWMANADFVFVVTRGSRGNYLLEAVKDQSGKLPERIYSVAL